MRCLWVPQTCWDTGSSACPGAKRLTHLLGFPSSSSVPIHGGLEAAWSCGMKVPFCYLPAWETALSCALGCCDSAGAGCVLQEGGGDKRPTDQVDVWILKHPSGNRIPGSRSAPKLGPDMSTLVRSVHILNKHSFLREVHYRHIEDVNIPSDGGHCISVVTASVVQLFDLLSPTHPWCPAKAVGQQKSCRTRL